MKTREKLVQALQEARAPLGMILNAERGVYDDYESPIPNPLEALVQDANAAGLTGIVNRAMLGEFDGSDEEGWAWYEREGKYLNIA
jgi:hypothetical protein